MAYFPGYYAANDGQYLFNTHLRGLWLFCQLAVKALLSLPHLFTAYLLVANILDRQMSGVVWVSIILLVSYLLSLLFHLLKAVLLKFKQRKNMLWLPLFLIALTYSCLFPTWMIGEALGPYLQQVIGEAGNLWIITDLFLFCIYCQVHFFNRFIFS